MKQIWDPMSSYIVCFLLLTATTLSHQALSDGATNAVCASDMYQCDQKGSDEVKCVPKNWVCDGDVDCPLGDDEKQSCEVEECGDDQFRCSDSSVVRCIVRGWQCDGEKDCDQGEDEDPSICGYLKKGTRWRGTLVDTFQCLPNTFQCPGTRHCIHASKLCNGHQDCPLDHADEGAHCRNRACRSKNCLHGLCKETYQGPMCYCPPGDMWNNTHCIDVDECQYDSFCDQLCTNAAPGYTCACSDGYTSPDDGSCRALGPRPWLLVANLFSVELRELNGSKVRDRQIAGDRITSVDFDIANRSICWMTYDSKIDRDRLMCSDMDNYDQKWEIPTQFHLKTVKTFAKDWVSGNWYFADDVKEVIFMCSPDGSHCMNILSSHIRRPKSIAVDASRGYLFYSEWSTVSHIGRVDLDGQNRVELNYVKLVHPNGLTLDLVNKHLYWGDSFLDVIERSDYNGTNRVVIAKGLDVSHVFGMTLFENFLYVSTHRSGHYRNQVIRIHRYDVTEPVVNVTDLNRPAVIKAIHQVCQPKVRNTDICANVACDHFCIPVPGPQQEVTAKCYCRPGYTLTADNTCQTANTSTFLVIANAQQGMVHSLSVDGEGAAGDLYPPIVNLRRPMALTYDATQGYIYYSDSEDHVLGRRRYDTEDEQTVIKSGITCNGIAVDWVGQNIYCSDRVEKNITVISIANASYVSTVVHEDIDNPMALLVDSKKGYLYWSNWVFRPSKGNASISYAHLDGSHREKLVSEEIQWPNGLAMDFSTNTLYWSDAFYDRIESLVLATMIRKVHVNFKSTSHPYGVAFYKNSIFWTESLDGEVHRHNLGTNQTSVFHSSSAPMLDLVLFSRLEQPVPETNPCESAGCSDLCVPLPEASFKCLCADGRRIIKDGKTCSGVRKEVVCRESQFTCTNGACILALQKCDGHRDCNDGSDEAMDSGAKCGAVSCSGDMFRCGNTTQCVFNQFVCDGEPDCIYGEDEKECDKHECPLDKVKCGHVGRCIPKSWECDGERDCSDGSDELPSKCCHGDKCSSANCTESEFRCLNGRCVPFAFRCDNEYDCPDHSDELDCREWCDPVREFKCKNSLVCLPIILQCDGEKNCRDGSDEDPSFCKKREPVCHSDEFACSDGTCLKTQFKCNDEKDCLDGSDELNCLNNVTLPEKTCHWTQFLCMDGSRCIPKPWRCDGEFDCEDKSDEMSCIADCQPPNFQCQSNKNMCISPQRLCDNHWDCSDHSDEGRLCEYNMCLIHECSDICHKSPYGYICSCRPNRRLRSDKRTCVDIDICEKWGVCSQKCTSTPEGYRCHCEKGYYLASDMYSCKPVDPQPIQIIFSNRHEIRRLNLANWTMVSLVSGLRNTIALDFHYEKQLIFWTDVIDDKIYSGKLVSNTVTEISAIIEFGLATTEGVAVDWVADNIYWVESNLDQIEVAKLDGSNRTTLIAGNMTSPRAIVLDPRVGLLFWTDWDGDFPRIERCSMAGESSTRQVVYDIRSHKGAGWPNGLAVDYEPRRLYWVDARSDSIHSVKYDGSDHRLIMKSHDTLNHPFSVTVFEHYAYWTDWRYNTLVMASKFNGSNVQVIQRTYTQPFDVQVFHPLRQPQLTGKKPCENNGGCSNLCLIGENLAPVCRCPHRFKLRADNKTCEEDNTFLLFVKEDEIRGVDLDNAHYNVIPSITVPFVENASSIDYDDQEERLYWTDTKKNVITSAYLNGTGITTVIDSGLSNPTAFAIDWLSRNMYFSSYTDSQATISVAKLDGAYRAEIYRTSNGKPNSIVISPSMGLMFWSDVGGKNHHIWKAKMDGSEPTIFVSKVSEPASLTLDHEENRLYWINRKDGAIFSCEIQANCITATRFVDVPLQSPISMTIYNTEVNKKIIFFANDTFIVKYQNKEKKVMRDNTPHVYDLQVYDPNSRRGKKNGCSDNNGGCNQLCLPSGTSYKCHCTAGYVLNTNGKNCSGIKMFLMYSTESEIHGIPLDTNASDTIQPALAPISKISLASSVDFHAVKDRIYWVDSTSRTISRIKRDLSGRETIVSEEISGVESLAVDWIGENIYWTDRGHNTIELTKLDGSKRYVITHGNMEKPRSIAVHPLKGYLFYGDWGKEAKIVRARLDGSEQQNFVTSTKDKPIKPYGLALDYRENQLYWCDRKMGVIEKVDVDSAQRTTLVTDISDCLSLAVAGDYLYWADVTGPYGSIKRVDKKTGENMKTIKTNITKLRDIKVFDSSVQTGSNVCDQNNGGCEELCLYRGNNQATCACSHGKLSADNRTCEEYSLFLLFSTISQLMSIKLPNITEDTPSKIDLNAPKDVIKNTTSMKNVIGLAFDYKTHRVFFTDIQQGNIQQVFFNGTGFKVIKAGVGSAEGLAFDNINGHLYYTSYTRSSIHRIVFRGQSTVDDGPADEMLITLSRHDHPRDIVIHPCLRRIFWTNWSDQRPSIQSATYSDDPSGRIVGKPESVITTNIRTPNGLAIDHPAQKLYWSDARLDKIERCDLDGSNRVVIVTTIPQHSFGLAVYGNYIYWTDWMLRAVLRASKYDGSGILWLRKSINRQPMGIIAVAPETDDCTTNPCHHNAYGCSNVCLVNERGQPYCNCSEGEILVGGKQCVLAGVSCDLGDFVCLDRQFCIPFNKTCNGIPDCPDASDESKEYCDTRQCPPDFYSCAAGTQCVSIGSLCDGKNDCSDGSDERACPCKDNEFRCDVGLCILAKYQCDYDSDCPDHSDEIGCNRSCSGLELSGIKHDGLISCNTTSMCIYPSWICDGSNDCWDGNDEKDCDHVEVSGCSEKAFTCKSGQCILKEWRCDKDRDCADNSDEEGCTYICEEGQQSCNDSTCIPTTWFCDGHPDCPDRSDEHENCGKQNCTEAEFKCPNGRCIPLEWKCDGDPDCTLGEDERTDAGCSATECASDQFQCLNRRCIRRDFYCDGDNDCGDQSDEPATCVYHDSCEPGHFMCGEHGKCIPDSQRCNGQFDCPDHSDEADCKTETPATNCNDSSYFQCNSGECIPSSLVCNGRIDCKDGSDEPARCNVNECESKYPVCHQKCVDKPLGYECQCFPGYQFKPDEEGVAVSSSSKAASNRKCVDIDECSTTYPCSQFCENKIGSYKCLCAEGYNLTLDNSTCKAVSPQPALLVSNRYYIRLTYLHTHNMVSVTSQLSNSVAVDYDWKEQMVYWSDITTNNSSINRMAYNFTTHKAGPMEVLHYTTVRNPDGIAVDWVGRNLYWCDKTTDTIEVSRLDGKYRRILLRQGLQEPRALEVFPQKGLLFFTDWGDTPHISRMNMDGSGVQQILNESIAWPNGLTIDYVTEKIFWADGNLDYIGMADLDGGNARVVVGDNSLVPHVFALTVFEGTLFWSDWEKMGVFNVSKFSGKHYSQILKFIHRPMDIQVVHPLRQLPVLDKFEKKYSPCDVKQCTHLCLLRPSERSEWQGIEAVCACPENHYLANDGKSCISNCTSSQFLCETTSKCIPFWWWCDGHKDCADGSDEPPTCPPYYCVQHGMFMCKNATADTRDADCRLPTQICDGESNCADGSDEAICDTYTCMEHYFKCHKDNKCIPEIHRCDKESHCSDSEDERDCPKTVCNNNQFQCNNGRCVPYVWRCDNDDDCGDGSDEPGNCDNVTCKEDHFKCESTGRCIPNAWKCDGDLDCGKHDSSDEDSSECHENTCDPTYFKCLNGHCIPSRWKCDYYDDCRDGSDEQGCSPRNCSEQEFRCTNGKCIHRDHRCNGIIDCVDRSDESDCPTKECDPETHFSCQIVKLCIPKKWRCDGDSDCPDGTDEWACDRNCTESEFKCNNSLCQPLQWRCDGDDDCGDGSDEDKEFCASVACPPGRFRCSNHKCIWNAMVCNGHKDCQDGEDEGDICEVVTSCKHPNFLCENRHHCVEPQRVCDGNNDCSDGSDELKEFCDQLHATKSTSTCQGPLYNGGCAHKCEDTMLGPKCSCRRFYTLAEDGFSCNFTNPCLKHGTCSQLCEFVEAEQTTRCSCQDGFVPRHNTYNIVECVASGTSVLTPLLVLEKVGQSVR